MLNDEQLQKKYLFYIDKQIEFGKQELERTSGQSELYKLALLYYNKVVDRRIAYTERYAKNLLKAFDFYRRRGKLEIIASCATHSFLPFISHNSESIQAQMEIPVSIYRRHFGNCPQGFWLPAMGWTSAIEPYLRAYNFR
jgi:1,4-alpha-glucan branching enzyme